MTINMKNVYYIVLALIVVVALIAIAGAIRFNLSDDDVSFAGSAVTHEDLVGDWVEPVPGFADQVQGFSLRTDGTATSINMATLLYKHWKLENGLLALAGESVGNRTSSEFEETYRIESLGQGRLQLIDAADQSHSLSRR